MAEVRQVDPGLVGAARAQAALDEGEPSRRRWQRFEVAACSPRGDTTKRLSPPGARAIGASTSRVSHSGSPSTTAR